MNGIRCAGAAALLWFGALTAYADQTGLEVVAEVGQAPGNLTVTMDGRILMSLHPFVEPEWRVAELAGGRLLPFPERRLASGRGQPALDAVLGIQADRSGIVWMLDSGLRSAQRPQLVGWDTNRHTVTRVIRFAGEVAPDNAFFNDLAVDNERDKVFIADPAGGNNAALVVVDLVSGEARRVLEGHASVVPEAVDLVIDGQPVQVKRPDGSLVRPHIGVNPIALEPRGEWLYFGPMHGTSMYRVRTEDLLDTNLSNAELGARVERYGPKPICDGIAVDRVGNVYLGDLANNGIGVITPDGEYRLLVSDPRLSWADAFSFGPDGMLYTVANQLHRSARLNAGVEAMEPPFHVLRIRPLAPGVPGR